MSVDPGSAPITGPRGAVEGPAVGDVIDDYRVDEILGVGGMGSVVAATHLPTGERRALKRILPRHLDNPEVLARFEREMHAAQALRSERVVRVYGIYRASDGAPLMEMELLTGVSFDKLWRSRGPMPIAEAVGYIVEVCEAVAEAHAAGIIHRDLKPANLFLATRPGAPPIVKVLDFGISKITRLDEHSEGPALTETDSNLGSPTYMSPEQVRSAKRVDRRTDIWALGLILYRLLTARPAFPASSVGEHLMMIVSDPPTPLRRHRPDAPEALEAVLTRCLQRDPDQRFQTVGQLVAALAPFAPPEVRSIVEAVATPEAGAAESAPVAARPVEPASIPIATPPAAKEEPPPPSLSQQTTAAFARGTARKPPQPPAWRYGAIGVLALAALAAGVLALQSRGAASSPAMRAAAGSVTMTAAALPASAASSSAPVTMEPQAAETATSQVEAQPAPSADRDGGAGVSGRRAAPTVAPRPTSPPASPPSAKTAPSAAPSAKLKGPVETTF
jgi:serine/threonine-protein kinase